MSILQYNNRNTSYILKHNTSKNYDYHKLLHHILCQILLYYVMCQVTERQQLFQHVKRLNNRSQWKESVALRMRSCRSSIINSHPFFSLSLSLLSCQGSFVYASS